MALRQLLAVAVVAGCAVGLSGATDHIVGDRTFCNLNINHTLWSGNHTFFVGDLLCMPLSLPSLLCSHDEAPSDRLLSLRRLTHSTSTFLFNVFVRAALRHQKGAHNVFEVNEAGYNSCTMEGVAGNWTSGKDFIPLKEPRRYFFICGNGLCRAGMKVVITVYPTPRQRHQK
ncbi:hypothetical protein ACQ4PT_039218 [Festuca glaucescens]